MKNKLTDLNNHLFAQLEKISDETLTGDKLKEEIARAQTMTEISSQIISAAAVTVNAFKLVQNGIIGKEDLPLLIGDKK